MVVFRLAESIKEYNLGKSLFLEYASEINIDLSFQDFNDELDNLRIQYSPPGGSLFVGYIDYDIPIGCFGIRRISDTTCELKRMYLKEEYRRNGIGDQMMRLAIKQANELDYFFMRLDTLPFMKPAIALYKKYGFYKISPYRHNPIPGAIYFEKDLNK